MAYAFDGWFDTVKDVAKSVVPKHTVVGKALQGDYSGAAKGAVKVAAKSAAPKAKAVPLPTAEGAGPGVFSPGGWVEQNQTYLLLAAAGLAAWFVLGRRKGRR